MHERLPSAPAPTLPLEKLDVQESSQSQSLDPQPYKHDVDVSAISPLTIVITLLALLRQSPRAVTPSTAEWMPPPKVTVSLKNEKEGGNGGNG